MRGDLFVRFSAQQLYVRNFNTDSGLPQSNVTSVVQTRDSYIWVGTEGGLTRLDGIRVRDVSGTSTTPAFDSDSIRCLFEDHSGALWIGTEAGLVRMIAGKFERLGLAGTSVRVIAEDSFGNVWVGTYGDGLYLWNGSTLRRIDRPGDLPTARVVSLCPDSHRKALIGTRSGSNGTGLL